MSYKIMSHRNYQNFDILSAAGATGAGATIRVDDYRNIMLSFATDGGSDAALTVKVQGSIQTDAPNFGAAQSATNHWDYIEIIDVEDGSLIDGDTGVSVATADDYRLFEVNTNGLKWLTVNVTARTQGEVTVKARCFD